MFDLFKNKKTITNSVVESEQRAKINTAISSLGIHLAPEDDNTQYCIQTSSAIVRKIKEAHGTKIEETDDDDIFTAGTILFVISNHITWVIGASFETVSSIAVCMCLCPETRTPQKMAEYVNPIRNLYNDIASNSKITIAIGQNLIKWIEHPTNEHFNKLVQLYSLCRKNIQEK